MLQKQYIEQHNATTQNNTKANNEKPLDFGKSPTVMNNKDERMKFRLLKTCSLIFNQSHGTSTHSDTKMNIHRMLGFPPDCDTIQRMSE